MPDYHDVFWRLLFGRTDCVIEFFRFLLKEKSEFLDLENLLSNQKIIYRKKILLYDISFIKSKRRNSEVYYLYKQSLLY